MKDAGKGGSKVVLRSAFGFLLFAGLMFGPAGTLNWLEAWIFLGLFFAFLAVVIIWLHRNDPGLLEERRSGGRKENTKKWDKVILAFYTLFLIAMLAVAGLDARRFGWSHVPWPVKLVGFLGLVAPSLFVFRVMRENTFVSERARIQVERGHRVCSSGPYRRIRHPMYLGIIVLFLFIPPSLGSFFAWIPAAIIILLFILRTALEDRMLHRELPGYREYAETVRFRLIPGIW